MTFNEAKELKKSLGYGVITKENIKYRIFVVPSNQSDRIRYFTFARGCVLNGLKDEDAINYSSNHDYILMGLYSTGDNMLAEFIQIDKNK